ncbi:hypothetical protein LINGRAHAP2_LOCUS8502 [Linum grandiflorum]
MGLIIIYFTSLLVLLLLAAEARTFPGDDRKSTVVIIYETSSPSSSLLPPLDLPALLSALTKSDGKDDVGRVSRPLAPMPKLTPPPPMLAPPKAELTFHPAADDGSVGRKTLTPPPTPKPASPTHYIAPRQKTPPGMAPVKSAWSLLSYV